MPDTDKTSGQPTPSRNKGKDSSGASSAKPSPSGEPETSDGNKSGGMPWTTQTSGQSPLQFTPERSAATTHVAGQSSDQGGTHETLKKVTSAPTTGAESDEGESSGTEKQGGPDDPSLGVLFGK